MDAIMVFRPTWNEFKDFKKYVLFMEARGAHLAGLAKIIPPREWIPRKNGYDIDNLSITIPKPVSQAITGQRGFYQQMHIEEKELTIQQYRHIANRDQYRTPEHVDFHDLEHKYWECITDTVSIYGMDVDGSLFDVNCNEWNINRLNTILDYVKSDYGVDIGGVLTSYLYMGMWKSTFAWHTEDADLYSINYLHLGQPKMWYAIPPQYGRRFEKLASEYFPASHRNCDAFLRHKTTLISPQILQQHNIPFNKVRFILLLYIKLLDMTI